MECHPLLTQPPIFSLLSSSCPFGLFVTDQSGNRMRKRWASVENSSEYWVPKGKVPVRHMGGSEFWEEWGRALQNKSQKTHPRKSSSNRQMGLCASFCCPFLSTPTLNCSSILKLLLTWHLYPSHAHHNHGTPIPERFPKVTRSVHRR